MSLITLSFNGQNLRAVADLAKKRQPDKFEGVPVGEMELTLRANTVKSLRSYLSEKTTTRELVIAAAIHIDGLRGVCAVFSPIIAPVHVIEEFTSNDGNLGASENFACDLLVHLADETVPVGS